ncbi:hypothetical protein HS961_07060 [Comamonas piscis]|uniref:Uncharacterized protein n=1 Tax=Comamonas piscis TaxID=1562974 RepID=A0A7G5EF42_9BURK|nr:hypothetical protein [Comamonas piscis]QMV72617.1 hypothetical protein HS961_07060 [Comamonas piscis]WSO35384.1 hypothetical protein VUJ63_07080 [Comamonas piscis]
MSRAQNIADKNGCDLGTAQRYLDLLEDGHTRYEASVMSGMRDPDETHYSEPSTTPPGADHGN